MKALVKLVDKKRAAERAGRIGCTRTLRVLTKPNKP
jgi:hypothetical protein